MKILIKNANLISMSEKRKKYEENIDILIENNKIAKIEKLKDKSDITLILIEIFFLPQLASKIKINNKLIKHKTIANGGK